MSHISSPSSRCAACKCLRRKCVSECILAPHFPSTNPQRFAWVHKVFGAANVTKMLEQVPMHMRSQAAECMIYEAATRMMDPVYGSVGIISLLQQQITQVQNEIVKTQGEIALHLAQQQQQQQSHTSHRQQLEGKTYNGPDIGPYIGPGLININGPTNGERGGSSNGQRYDLDDVVDCLYDNFN